MPMTRSMSLLPLQKEWFFHWDHAQVAITPFFKMWFAAHSIEHLWHSTGHQACSCGFLLVLEGKGDLTGLSLDKDSLTETLVGVTTTVITDKFSTAIRQ